MCAYDTTIEIYCVNDLLHIVSCQYLMLFQFIQAYITLGQLLPYCEHALPYEKQQQSVAENEVFIWQDVYWAIELHNWD